MKISYLPETSTQRFDPVTGQSIKPPVIHYLQISDDNGENISYGLFSDFDGIEEFCRKIVALYDHQQSGAQ